MAKTMQELEGRMAYLRTSWQNLWSSKADQSFTDEEVSDLRNWQQEMTDLGAQITQKRDLEAMAQDIVGGGSRSILPAADNAPTHSHDFATKLAAQPDFQAFKASHGGTFVMDFAPGELGATLITVSDGAPQNVRLSRIEPYPVETRTVADMMAQGTIDRGTLEYYEETTFTNSAATVAEGAAKPESALDWTLRTESVSKIATWIPATSEALEDISWLRSTIENRLRFMVARVEEAQLINGDGTAPNISGITDRSGLQTQAKGADPVPDAILKAMNLIRVNALGYEPDGLAIHPLDMQDIRLLKTADGIYIFGSPADPMTSTRLWGLEIRETTGETQNTALVGAFGTAAQVFRRSGVTVTASTEHASYFIENKVAILAEERLGLAVYKPAAFCTVTGI